jgi:GNAT superfamily N-acetyltransferase
MTWIIREARNEDAQQLTGLTEQLGYRVDSSLVARQLKPLLRDPDHEIFVSELDGTLVGWVHVYRSPLFYGSFAEIGGLVVDESFRGQGLGRALMEKAEEWARSKGIPEIRLRSGGHRKEAHIFYERIGYEQIKQQKVFSKTLS